VAPINHPIRWDVAAHAPAPPFGALLADILAVAHDDGIGTGGTDLAFVCTRQEVQATLDGRVLLDARRAGHHYDELIALGCPVILLGIVGLIPHEHRRYLVRFDHAGSVGAPASKVGIDLCMPSPSYFEPPRYWFRAPKPLACDVTHSRPQEY
jgi:hypothetical protein